MATVNHICPRCHGRGAFITFNEITPCGYCLGAGEVQVFTPGKFDRWAERGLALLLLAAIVGLALTVRAVAS